MTWAVAISFAVGVIIKLIMSPPSAVVEWILGKFALHQKLKSNEVTVTFNGNPLEEEEKSRFTAYFNEATFLKKYYIFPGNEALFLNPDASVPPIVVHLNRGKTSVNLYVYCYESHVDIVKQYKKKVLSYCLRSEHLQNSTRITEEFRNVVL